VFYSFDLLCSACGGTLRTTRQGFREQDIRDVLITYDKHGIDRRSELALCWMRFIIALD
jgi:hypothetical protein